MKFKNTVFLVLTLFLNQAIAQKIKIIDQNTQQAIPFVNIQALGTKNGLSSNIDGVILLDNKFKGGILISHVSYQTLRLSSPYPSVIKLVSKENILSEIIVNNFNPAFSIIKKAVSNRDNNNPKKLNSFSHYAYSKLSTELVSADSLQKRKDQYFLMSESRTKHQFLQPNFEEETIISHKTSGIKNPLFSSILTDFQPFSFYDELIHLKIDNKYYLNPISQNSWKKYDFVLSDTIVNANDTTFVIAFSPKTSTTFEGFKGLLHINTDGYAIENISAETANINSTMIFRMQQHYEKVENHWFPKQQNTELIVNVSVPNKAAKNAKQMYVRRVIKYTHKTYMSDIQINNPIKKTDFSGLSRVINSKSYQADESFWNKYRSDSLNLKEQNTYKFYESLPANKLEKMDRMFDLMETFISGYIPFHKFQIPLNTLFDQNNYEGIRIGFGLNTGKILSERLSAEGYLGYGFKDKAFKYGFSTRLNVKNTNTFLQASFKQDVVEPCGNELDFGRKNNLLDFGFRNFLIERMDSVQQAKISFQTPISRNGLVQMSFTNETRNPAYPYQFKENASKFSTESFKISALQVGFRWAWGEKFAQLSQVIYQSEPAKAILQCSFEKGLNRVLNSQFDYTKINLSFQQQLVHRILGKTFYQLKFSKIWGDLPYSYLINGAGSSNRLGYLMIPNTFQTMGLYEFTSDQQASLLIQQNIGRLFLSKKASFQPELIISQGVSYGSLRNPQNHQGLDTKSLDKGYFESGLSLNKLLRIKYLQVIYLDFGIGAFIRYGNNSFSKMNDNLTFRWSFGASF
ncbi:DUF5686 family protein [Flectobacillus major]|uniref:DUF5686 family protein n=1 Tax=Flectobacillus major TaxID=103 RepID=UPI0003F6AA0E|nr:DUF5686 family protein [Flectobacillus major]